MGLNVVLGYDHIKNDSPDNQEWELAAEIWLICHGKELEEIIQYLDKTPENSSITKSSPNDMLFQKARKNRKLSGMFMCEWHE